MKIINNKLGTPRAEGTDYVHNYVTPMSQYFIHNLEVPFVASILLRFYTPNVKRNGVIVDITVAKKNETKLFSMFCTHQMRKT